MKIRTIHSTSARPLRQLLRDYVTRNGIDVSTRELLTFSMLVALSGAEGQVKAHVTANLHVGNDRATLIDAITQLIPFIGFPRSLNGLRSIDENAPIKDSTSSN